MLPNKRHGLVLTVGLALLAVGLVGTAAADPGVSVSADGDGAELEVTGDNSSLTCTFAPDAEGDEPPCDAEAPVENPDEGDDDGDDGDDGASLDPSVDAEVGPDGATATASAGDGSLTCEVAPPEEGEEPAAPCEAEAPGNEELPEDDEDEGDGDDGESANVEFEGSVGEDGVSASVSSGEDGVTCAVGPDDEGEEPPCEQHGDDGGDGDDGDDGSPADELPTDELPTEQLPTEELPVNLGPF